MKCESASRRFQPGEGPSRGLLRDCEIVGNIRITFVSSTKEYSPRPIPMCPCCRPRLWWLTGRSIRSWPRSTWSAAARPPPPPPRPPSPPSTTAPRVSCPGGNYRQCSRCLWLLHCEGSTKLHYNLCLQAVTGAARRRVRGARCTWRAARRAARSSWSRCRPTAVQTGARSGRWVG